MEKVFIIGGPGNISTSCIEMLVGKGYDVALLTRPGDFDKNSGGALRFFNTYEGKNIPAPYLQENNIQKKLKFYFADRNNKDELRAALDDFKPDLAVDFVCFMPEQAESIADLLYGRLDHFVFISTVDIYGYPLSRLPMSENDRYKTPVSDYAKNKLECEKVFKANFDKNKFPLTIARPAYSFGTMFLLSYMSRFGGKFMIPRIRKKMPVLVPGDGKALFHYGAAFNTGRMIGRILTDERTIGRSYSCAHEIMYTQDDYIKHIANVIGVEPNIAHIPSEHIISLDGEAMRDNLVTELTQFNLAFDIKNFKNDFPDFKWAKLEPIIKDYIDWHDKLDLFVDPEEEIIDDKIIAAWSGCIKNFKPDLY
jgi:nucleoside-diphosphate-sugar epimerase